MLHYATDTTDIVAVCNMTALEYRRVSSINLSKKHLSEELERVIARFRSLEQLARTLRSYPGFQDLHRSTVSRWLTKPSRRTERALQILGDTKEAHLLRVADLRPAWALPSLLLDVRRRDPTRLLAKAPVPPPSMRVEHFSVASLDLAFEQAREEDADLLIIPRVATLEPPFVRLCSLAKIAPTAYASERAQGEWDISGLSFKLLQGAGWETLLARDKSISNTEMLKNPQAFLNAMTSGHASAFVAWEPEASQFFEDITRTGHELHAISNLFEPVPVDLLFNSGSHSASHIRDYLYTLLLSTEFIETNRPSEGLIGPVRQLLSQDPDQRLSNGDVRSILKTCRFGVDDISLKNLLSLWTQDVHLHDPD